MANPKKSILGEVAWLFFLFTIGAAATCVVFFVFIPGPERGMTFYVSISMVVAAEFILFSQLLHSKLVKTGAPTASPATRIQVFTLIFIWLLLTIIGAAVAVNPSYADTLTADRILTVYIVFTFLFYLGAYFLYNRDIKVEESTRALKEERREYTSKIPAIEEAITIVSDLGRRESDYAEQCDTIAKKLNTLRSSLEAIPVSERAMEESEDNQKDWQNQFEQKLSQLMSPVQSLSESTNDQVQESLNTIAVTVESIIVLLKRRSHTLTH